MKSDALPKSALCTVRNELACLRHLLRLAQKKWGYLDRVPEIELPKGPKDARASSPKRKLDGSWRHAASQRIHTCPPSSCWRSIPACGTVKFSTCNGNVFELDKDLGFNAHIRLYNTKNGEARGVPLNKQAIAALISVEPDPAQRIGRVFKRSNGKDWGQIRTAFEAAVKRAALPDFRFHDLRHTCGSHLAQRGRPIKEIQEVLGHKSFAMTLRYAHLSPMHLRSAVESLDGSDACTRFT